MPNSRRRKFSVRNEIASWKTSKGQNVCTQTSEAALETEIKALASNLIVMNCSSKCFRHAFSDPGPDPAIKTTVNSLVTLKYSLSKNKMYPQSSRTVNNIDIIPECESSSSLVTDKKRSNSNVDKDVIASSNNIELNIVCASEDTMEPCKDCTETTNTKENSETPSIKIARQLLDSTPLKREKYPHPHRIKVRSPKRRMGIGILDSLKSNDVHELTSSVGTDAIDWEREVQICEDNTASVAETNEEDERQSDHSSDDMCRICHGSDSLSQELGPLVSACSCRGTVGRVHVKCLERWLTESGKSRCELCGTRYSTRRVHRYGVPRALFMWILSQNAKQLMVDSLGIMLMSPLAVLAAWLSGRTLAGLMTQDIHGTPWPLASTFVLACMTLVCYYCWIVSAATRHALGWWIWYRSQYEVRLELMDVEE